MTREDKLRSEAKTRRLLKTLGPTSTKAVFDANKPENMYNSDYEINEGWEESGVMDVVRDTIGEDIGW